MTHSQIDRITTQQSSDLYISAANLKIYQNVVYYQGIKIYHHLPKTVKYLSGDKNKFKIAWNYICYITAVTVWRNSLVYK